MNAIERLPQYIQSIAAPAKRQLEEQLETLLAPLGLLGHRMQGLLAGVLAAGEPVPVDDETVHLQLATLGIVGNFLDATTCRRLDCATLRNLLILYPFYVEQRGTPAGLASLVRLLVPKTAFTISERSFPRPAVRVGETRLAENGRALHAEDSEARSLIITIATERAEVEYADVLDQLLTTEVPVGLRAFVVYLPPPPALQISAVPPSWPNLGDRL